MSNQRRAGKRHQGDFNPNSRPESGRYSKFPIYRQRQVTDALRLPESVTRDRRADHLIDQMGDASRLRYCCGRLRPAGSLE